MTEENTLQQEVNRLTTALDHAERLNEKRLDVCRAAQRLHDAIHLAGVTTVTIKNPVVDNTRAPASTTTTITDRTPLLADAIQNLNDALKHLYQPGGPRD